MIKMGYTTHQEDLAQVSEKLLHALSLPVGEISIKIIFGYDMDLANYLVTLLWQSIL